ALAQPLPRARTVDRAHTRYQPGDGDAVGRARGNGEREGAAARIAEHREPVDAEAISQGNHVVGPARQGASAYGLRAPDAGPVGTQHADALGPGRRVGELVAEAA